MNAVVVLPLLFLLFPSGRALAGGKSYKDAKTITSTIFLYVNDASTIGDVYTTAPGSPENPGKSPAAPISSLQQIFDLYNLEDGDYFIFVDTGTYPETVLIEEDDGAPAFAPITIFGSTNDQAGGSLFNPSPPQLSDAVFRLSAASNIVIQSIRARSLSYGFTFDGGATNCSLVRCRAESNTFAGIKISGSLTGVSVSNCVIYGAGSRGVHVEGGAMRLVNNTIFGQTAQGVRIDAGFLHAAQNIVLTRHASAACVTKNGGVYVGDYNNLAHDAGSSVGFINGAGPLETLMDWQDQTGQDSNSISLDPMLADEFAGHAYLRSMAGRYSPSGGVFVIDGTHSPSIDAGNPGSAFGSELPPNGGRVNQGAYGNTAQASKSRTNGTLTVRNYSDGGNLQGVSLLTWFAHGAATGHTLTIEYSLDQGQTWMIIASNISAAAGSYEWDTFLAHDTRHAIWRIVSENDQRIASQSGAGFSINSGLVFESEPGPSGLTMSWYGDTGRLYRLKSPTGALADVWAPTSGVIFSNGSPFTIATGVNGRIVVAYTNSAAKHAQFFGLEAEYTSP